MPATLLRSRLAAAFIVFASAAASSSAANYAGTVTQVRDGDTVQVTTDRGEKLEVRLDGIDAPEKGYKGRPAQRYAEQSRLALSRIALKQRVNVESERLDHYGRRVGVLWVQTDDGELDAGLMQVQLGMARIVPKYLPSLPEELHASYRYAEAIAKSRGRGVWAQQKGAQQKGAQRKGAQPEARAKAR